MVSLSMTLRAAVFGGMFIFAVGTAVAQEVCVPDVIDLPAPAESKAGEDGILPIELEGDEVESIGQDVVILRGNAQLKRGRQAVFGDKLSYRRDTDELEGEGNVIFYSEFGDKIEVDHIKLEVQTQIGEAKNAKYHIARRGQRPEGNKSYGYARGTADEMSLRGHDVTRLKNVSYTTCVEGQDDVIVNADEMTIDQGTGRGLAKNVTVRFKKVPIFYSPVLSFPINDQRKSGFLFPTVGFQEGSGLVLATPYYFNLAPNYDATLTPRVYSDRGVQVGTEFRYMTKNTDGYVYGEYLPSDDKFGDDRAAFTFRHDHVFTDRVDGEVDLQWVSDEQYFDDFSNDIQISSATFLSQTARLRYSGDIWRIDADATSYISVDDTIASANEPHERLPRVRIRSKFPEGPGGIQFGFESEVVNFVQSERLEGLRFDATPSVERQFEKLWGFVTPRLSLRHTSYSLDNVEVGAVDDPSRTVPVFSMDSGIFLERLTGWGDRPFIHTLEPRLFYVFIPEDNQDDLPTFDTAVVNLNNFNNIFRENRFFGRDRVGDTNQVTLGLTSRMIEADTGREWAKASVGQVFFLENREVTLTPGEVLTDDNSDFLAELRANLTDRWTIYGFAQYDTGDSQIREAKADIFYRVDNDGYIDLEYRFSDGNTEQVTLQTRWPVAPRWHILFDDRYSIRDSENLETTLGVEYNACCWKARLFGQRRAQSDSTFRNAIIFEFELTGLARVRTGF